MKKGFILPLITMLNAYTASYSQTYTTETDYFTTTTTLSSLINKHYSFENISSCLGRTTGRTSIQVPIPSLRENDIYLTDTISVAYVSKLKSLPSVQQTYKVQWNPTGRTYDVVIESDISLNITSDWYLHYTDDPTTKRYGNEWNVLTGTATLLDTEDFGLDPCDDDAAVINTTIVSPVYNHTTEPEFFTASLTGNFTIGQYDLRLGKAWGLSPQGESFWANNGGDYFILSNFVIPSASTLDDSLEYWTLNSDNLSWGNHYLNSIVEISDYYNNAPQTLSESISIISSEEWWNYIENYITKEAGLWTEWEMNRAIAEAIRKAARNSYQNFDIPPKLQSFSWNPGPYLSDNIKLDTEIVVEIAITYLVEVE